MDGAALKEDQNRAAMAKRGGCGVGGVRVGRASQKVLKAGPVLWEMEGVVGFFRRVNYVVEKRERRDQERVC